MPSRNDGIEQIEYKDGTSQFHSVTSAGHITRIYPNAAPICQCVLVKYDILQIITPSVD
jgi:hypothetical protein